MAKFKTIDQITKHSFSSNDTDFYLDSDYYKDPYKGITSENDEYGADFRATRHRSNTYLPTVPNLMGYIKNDVLHFSILECRGTDDNHLFLAYDIIFFPTELKFVHEIMNSMHEFGRKHNLVKYAHLKYKIDWQYYYKIALDIHCESHLSNKNKIAYEEALDEYLPYHSLQKAQAILGRVLGGENKLINNKSFKHKIEEANSDILSIIYTKKLMKKHYQFQKSQENDNLKS